MESRNRCRLALCIYARGKENGAQIKLAVTANTSSERRNAVVKVLSPIQNYVINVTQYASSDIVISEDIKVIPSGGKASEFQPGQGIENTWDGKFSADGANPYHSVWGQSANFPVTLEYYFQGGADIDYLIYYTRAGNGNFGELDLLIATDEGHSNWTNMAHTISVCRMLLQRFLSRLPRK